jgi:hypothetical protein
LRELQTPKAGPLISRVASNQPTNQKSFKIVKTSLKELAKVKTNRDISAEAISAGYRTTVNSSAFKASPFKLISGGSGDSRQGSRI